MTIDDAGARTVYRALHTLRDQAIMACTGTNKAIMLMRERPVHKSLFGGFLQSAVSKASTALLNYTALLQQFRTAGFTKPQPPLTLGRRRQQPFQSGHQQAWHRGSGMSPTRDDNVQQLGVQ